MKKHEPIISKWITALPRYYTLMNPIYIKIPRYGLTYV